MREDVSPFNQLRELESSRIQRGLDPMEVFGAVGGVFGRVCGCVER